MSSKKVHRWALEYASHERNIRAGALTTTADWHMVTVPCKEAQPGVRKGNKEEDCKPANTEANTQDVKHFLKICEINSTPVLDLRDTHSVFGWETLNANRTAACLQESATEHF